MPPPLQFDLSQRARRRGGGLLDKIRGALAMSPPTEAMGIGAGERDPGEQVMVPPPREVPVRAGTASESAARAERQPDPYTASEDLLQKAVAAQQGRAARAEALAGHYENLYGQMQALAQPVGVPFKRQLLRGLPYLIGEGMKAFGRHPETMMGPEALEAVTTLPERRQRAAAQEAVGWKLKGLDAQHKVLDAKDMAAETYFLRLADEERKIQMGRERAASERQKDLMAKQALAAEEKYERLLGQLQHARTAQEAEKVLAKIHEATSKQSQDYWRQMYHLEQKRGQVERAGERGAPKETTRVTETPRSAADIDRRAHSDTVEALTRGEWRDPKSGKRVQDPEIAEAAQEYLSEKGALKKNPHWKVGSFGGYERYQRFYKLYHELMDHYRRKASEPRRTVSKTYRSGAERRATGETDYPDPFEEE